MITFTIEEGEQYRVGTVDVQIDHSGARSRIAAGEAASLSRRRLQRRGGREDRRGHDHRSLEARLCLRDGAPKRDARRATRTVNLLFTVSEGQRAYIERINVRGNTRTRDYVIRREFDLAEGDAYNRALVNRAERRLKNLSVSSNP